MTKQMEITTLIYNDIYSVRIGRLVWKTRFWPEAGVSRKVDVRLPGKENLNSRGARPDPRHRLTVGA